MVGVAGRSRGCNTCRKRKKGCDFQRPACRRCLNAGLQCSGYERERVFVHYPTPDEDETKQLTQVAARPATHNVTLHPSLTRSAREIKYLDMFWDLYIPDRKRFTDTLAKYSYEGSWVPSMGRLLQTDPALHKIMISLCLGTLGRDEGNQWMCEESAKLYVDALQEMNTGLQIPSRRRSDALLLSAKIFGLYDLLYGSDDGDMSLLSRATSWQKHTLGQLALILQRTPEMYVESPVHDLFVEGRMGMTMMSIGTRKRNVLGNTNWRTVPWTNRPKTPKDLIFDILDDIVGILEDFDSANALSEPAERDAAYLRVVDACWAVDSSLMWWLENFAPKEDCISRMGTENTTAEDVAIAHIMSNYWAACLLAYATLRQAVSASSIAFTLSTLPERTDPHVFCARVIDAKGVLLSPSAGVFGTYGQVFPLGVACIYLFATQGDTECTFHSAAMRTMLGYFAREDTGPRMRGFVLGILRNTTMVEEEEGDGDGEGDEVEVMTARSKAWFGMDRGLGDEDLETVVGRLLW